MTIVSPCRQLCRMGEDRLCDGCGRTLEEIGAWLTYSGRERAAVMARVAGWRMRDDDPTRSDESPR